MSEIESIRGSIDGFLRGVKRRATLEASLRWAGLTLSAWSLAVCVLALIAAKVGPAAFWPKLTGTVLSIVTLLGVTLLILTSLRHLRTNRGLAIFIGRRVPGIGSDLVSAVELSELDEPDNAFDTSLDERQAAQRIGSRSILDAFYGSVARAIAPLDLRRLIPLRKAAWAGGAFGGGLLIVLVAFLVAPKTMGRGLGLLFHEPTRFEGAVVSREPLIADVSITYVYPAHTRLGKRTVEGSTGDVVAPRGTKVTLRARLLRKSSEVALLLGETGELGELPLTVKGHHLESNFALNRNDVFRVWLAPVLGRPVREDRGHRLVAEPDQPPRVEIFGPADRLELATPRPIEVGYSASDDFGLGVVDLVYRIDDGKEQRVRLKEAKSERATQGRTVFDPDLSAAQPGTTISYRIEARDNDGVLGAKLGSSRSLTIVVQDPKENLDDQLVRQREVLDRLIDNLGDRLEAVEQVKDDAPEAARAAVTFTQRLAVWQSLHEVEEAQVAALGRVIDEQRRTGDTSKPILTALASIAERLARRLREENDLLGQLRTRVPESAAAAAGLERLHREGRKHIAELETAILLLDDVIGRQRLEDLSALAQSLTDAFQRLQDLLARYRATKDPALRAQLEREIRDLKSRIEQLAEKIATLKARNEVSSEWQNLPNLDEAMEKAKSFSNLLDKGDPNSLEKALSELGDSLERVRSMLGENAQEFGESRFPQENRAMSETLKKLGDLEGDERSLAGDSAQLAQEVEANLEKERAAELDKFLNETKEKLDRLRNRLATPQPRDLDEDTEDELRRAQESAKQMQRLLPEREWGEARREAERAVSSLRRLRQDLEKRGEPRKGRPGAATRDFEDAMKEAGGAAQEIASGLEKLIPKAGERMSNEQRGRSQGMSDRQGNLQQRASELAQEASGKSGEAPELDRAAQELRSIGEQMGDARGELARGSARDGSGKARDAADRLSKLRDSLKGQEGAGKRNGRRELVRIPGADESKAPREWRQELMEAMREKAPERYGDEVRRYYEELVK